MSARRVAVRTQVYAKLQTDHDDAIRETVSHMIRVMYDKADAEGGLDRVVYDQFLSDVETQRAGLFSSEALAPLGEPIAMLEEYVRT